jgi:hypothetical protein
MALDLLTLVFSLEIWFNILTHEWGYKTNHWIQSLQIQKSLVDISGNIKQGTMI